MKVILILALGLCCASLPAQEAEKLDAKAIDAAFSQSVRRPSAILGAKGARNRGTASTAEPEKERTYSKSARVIKRADGSTIESPYVQIPILFAKDTSELLGETSRQNAALLAQKMKEYGAKGACFSIEGHASAEGQGTRNQLLSDQRAAVLRDLLISRHGVDPALIESAKGFGSRFAKAPATAYETDLQQDRRVLVVREK